MDTPLRPSSARKRTAALRAAEEVFLRDGYTAATMDEVAARSGVSKQTLYAHFGSKEALFVELVTSMTEDAGLRTTPPAPTEPDDLVPFLEDHARRLVAGVLTPRILRLRRLVIGEVSRFPDLGEALWDAGPARAMSWMTDRLRAFHAAGWLEVPDPARAASTYNWLVMSAPLNEAMLLGDDIDLSAARVSAHCREAVRVFVAAHAPTPDRAVSKVHPDRNIGAPR